DPAHRPKRHAQLVAVRALPQDVDLVQVPQMAGVGRDADIALGLLLQRLGERRGGRVAAVVAEAALEEGDLVCELESLRGETEAGTLATEGARAHHEQSGEQRDQGDEEGRAPHGWIRT